MTNKELLNISKNAYKNSYSPYSGFKVGAAIVSKSNKIFCGTNVENASYSVTCCAERVALFNAITEGEREFEKIAITSEKGGSVFPCGVCRQALFEFSPSIKIILENDDGNALEYDLKSLLPNAFNKNSL